jgi:hypothetical protein
LGFFKVRENKKINWGFFGNSCVDDKQCAILISFGAESWFNISFVSIMSQTVFTFCLFYENELSLVIL